MKKEWKPTKAKRIAQVSFQAKIDTSNGSTTARSETRDSVVEGRARHFSLTWYQNSLVYCTVVD